MWQRFITDSVMDESQVERWLHELDADDEDVIESEDDEVEPEVDLQALVRESEVQENERNNLAQGYTIGNTNSYPKHKDETTRPKRRYS
ncbi:hypothetical protein EVAR_88_1 [Eumeta japonica]|uniref:Uncharacterized protein n=1 Tax=Eumeta variegata TaxID=151549 RepID=A0A4C1S894_EUMVA|nr:hypothetical protein EVAR_88_1 [Eumeta japonica]